MKITKLETFRLQPRWLLLRVETDDGFVGWGEPVVEGRVAATQACVHELESYLIWQDPRRMNISGRRCTAADSTAAVRC